MSNIKIFEEKKIRSYWKENEEKWYFSVIDIIRVLTDENDFQKSRNYWKILKYRLIKEGSEVVTKCNRLKLVAEDGKLRETDCLETQDLLRLIQSIPSPKAEPFKLWLAKVGYERLQKISDPEQSIDRARENWQNMGRSEKWIQQRMMGPETRNKLTDYWKSAEIKDKKEFAILTSVIHKEWSGLTVKEHKELKDIEQII